MLQAVRPEGVRAGATAVVHRAVTGAGVGGVSSVVGANPGTWFSFVAVCHVPCKFIMSSRKAEKEVSSRTLFVPTWSQALKQQPWRRAGRSSTAKRSLGTRTEGGDTAGEPPRTEGDAQGMSAMLGAWSWSSPRARKGSEDTGLCVLCSHRERPPEEGAVRTVFKGAGPQQSAGGPSKGGPGANFLCMCIYTYSFPLCFITQY